MALPDGVQLRRRLPARHQHHAGDPRGLLGDRGATRLSPRAEPGWDSLWRSVGAKGESESGRDVGGGPSDAAGAGRTFIVRTDGAARGNPGPASSGAVLIDAATPGSRRPDAPPIATISEYLGIQTNNVAEYTAVVRALGLADELGARRVEMLLDSKLIVEQLHGRWRVKDAKLIPLHAEAKAHLARFERWSATHVPRAQNKQADALCNEAIDRAQAGGARAVVVRP
ncbi:MAG TPA: ribonuclease HI family protein [Candidatus Limnocylindrales bacterium]